MSNPKFICPFCSTEHSSSENLIRCIQKCEEKQTILPKVQFLSELVNKHNNVQQELQALKNSLAQGLIEFGEKNPEMSVVIRQHLDGNLELICHPRSTRFFN